TAVASRSSTRKIRRHGFPWVRGSGSVTAAILHLPGPAGCTYPRRTRRRSGRYRSPAAGLASDVRVRPDGAAAEHPALELVDLVPVDGRIGRLVPRRRLHLRGRDLEHHGPSAVVDELHRARGHDVMRIRVTVAVAHDHVALAGRVARPRDRPDLAVRRLHRVALDALVVPDRAFGEAPGRLLPLLGHRGD